MKDIGLKLLFVTNLLIALSVVLLGVVVISQVMPTPTELQPMINTLLNN